MSDYTRFPNGSEWRKWDLHIHAPGTVLNDLFCGKTLDEKWDLYLTEVEAHRDVAVLGITDYCSIQCFEQALSYWKEGRMPDIKLLIPNIEFRILPVTGDNRAINLHLLVNPAIVSQLDSLLFSQLKFHYKDNPYLCTRQDLIRLGRAHRSNQPLSDEQAYREGVNQFKITLDDLREVLDQSRLLRENVFVGIVNSSKDGASGIQEDDSLTAIRTNLYRAADFIFSPRQNDVSFFTGKGAMSAENLIENYGGLKPCLHGSDAHKNDEILRPAMDRFTWIKADPTFEGLRQVMVEPEARVRIQPHRPEQKNKHQVIRRVRFLDSEGRFGDKWIELNPNLNSIIGGKSSGKSLLLYHIARTLDPQRIDDLNDGRSGERSLGYDFEDEKDAFDFEVEWEDGRTQRLHGPPEGDHRPVTYIPQLHLIHLVENKQEELHSIIERTLLDASPTYKIKRGKLDVQIKAITEDLESSIRNYLTTMARLEVHQKARRELGDKQAVADSIAHIDKELEEIRLESQLNDTEKELYDELTKRITRATIQQSVLATRKTALEAAREEYKALAGRLKDAELTELSKSVAERVTAFNDAHRFELEQIARRIGDRLYAEMQRAIQDEFSVINDLSERLEEKTQELNAATKELQPLQDKIKNQTLLDELQKQRSSLVEKQRQMENMDAEIESLKMSLSLDQIMRLYGDRLNFYDEILNDTNEHGEISEGLSVQAAMVHDDEAFENKFLSQLNRRKSLQKQFEEVATAFVDNEFSFDRENHLHHVQGIATSIIDGTVEFRRGYDKETAFRALFDDYMRLRYTVVHDGDDMWSMSPGKRGILLLQLLLHLSNSQDPILIDQPEDNLDNRTIYEELNNFIRTKKLDRQIIIVTHNANLVVSTDSENVIVANQDPGGTVDNAAYRFEYVTGSLEHTFLNDEAEGVLYRQGIREHVCQILEGGIEAFEKREQKYGISRLREQRTS